MPGDNVDDIARYLNELCWAMGGAFAEQQAVRDELRAHIRDEVRELELGGVPSGVAVAQALRDLGDATELGRTMRRSRGTAAVRRPLTQPAGALLLERHRPRHLPPLGMALALAASGAASLAVALAYAWPG
jgi:hypothetical protein